MCDEASDNLFTILSLRSTSGGIYIFAWTSEKTERRLYGLNISFAYGQFGPQCGRGRWYGTLMRKCQVLSP
jgi:hypothetical protein